MCIHAPFLIAIHTYLENVVGKCAIEYQADCTASKYNELVNVTLTKLITFNKRCSGDASRIELEQCANIRSTSSMSDTEYKATLKPVKRELCKWLNIVNITGEKKEERFLF